MIPHANLIPIGSILGCMKTVWNYCKNQEIIIDRQSSTREILLFIFAQNKVLAQTPLMLTLHERWPSLQSMCRILPTYYT